MTRKASNLQPRREFLKLAAFTGAAALTGKKVAAAKLLHIKQQKMKYLCRKYKIKVNN